MRYLLTVETKGLLFDMDGVLISSTGSVVRCWQRWCKLYGMPNAEQFQVPHGTRAADIVRMLKPEFDEAQVAEGLHTIEELELVDTVDLTVLPGVKALLERLPPERWAVVSSATRRLLIGRLAAAGLPVPERRHQRRHGGARQARSGAVPARRGAAGVCAQRSA